jgi:uncharacterized protein YkwD
MLFLLFLLPFASSSSSVPLTSKQHQESKKLTYIVNTVRQKAKKPPVSHSPILDRLAWEKSHAMHRTGNFEHYHPELPSVQDLMEKSQEPWKLAGENLALNYLGPHEAVKGWLESPTHRNNLLEDAFNVHGSCRVGPYYTQIFAHLNKKNA